MPEPCVTAKAPAISLKLHTPFYGHGAAAIQDIPYPGLILLAVVLAVLLVVAAVLLVIVLLAHFESPLFVFYDRSLSAIYGKYTRRGCECEKNLIKLKTLNKFSL